MIVYPHRTTAQAKEKFGPKTSKPSAPRQRGWLTRTRARRCSKLPHPSGARGGPLQPEPTCANFANMLSAGRFEAAALRLRRAIRVLPEYPTKAGLRRPGWARAPKIADGPGKIATPEPMRGGPPPHPPTPRGVHFATTCAFIPPHGHAPFCHQTLPVISPKIADDTRPRGGRPERRRAPPCFPRQIPTWRPQGGGAKGPPGPTSPRRGPPRSLRPRFHDGRTTSFVAALRATPAFSARARDIWVPCGLPRSSPAVFSTPPRPPRLARTAGECNRPPNRSPPPTPEVGDGASAYVSPACPSPPDRLFDNKTRSRPVGPHPAPPQKTVAPRRPFRAPPLLLNPSLPVFRKPAPRVFPD